MSITTASAPAVAAPSSRSIRALGALNFFLADVRDGLGPFLGIFLIGQGWQPDMIGFVMTLGGLAGMLATTPLGALADASRAKRFMVAFCAGLVILASLAILIVPSVPFVAASQIATGIAGAAIGPAIAGLTLGIVGHDRLAHQIGRNEAWNHAGNGFAAAGAGFFGYEFGLTAVFILMTMMAMGSIIAVMIIRADDIDHDVARGLERRSDSDRDAPSSFGLLLKNLPIVVLAVTLMLFHFSNAAMLPLLGQQVAAEKLSREAAVAEPLGQGADVGKLGATIGPATLKPGEPAVTPTRYSSTLEDLLADPVSYAAATVIIAQLTMIPIALLAASFAAQRGYFLLLVAALIALPLRGLIAGLWASPYALLPVQMLDGVGAGLLGVAVPGLVARILRGTGHINAGLGAVMTVQGIGAALSPAVAGAVVTAYGYSAAYLFLAAFAVAGFVIWLAAARHINDGGATA